MLDVALGTAGDFAGDGAHVFSGFEIVADDVVHGIGQEIAGGTLDQVRFPVDIDGCRVGIALGFYLMPLFHEHGQIADEVAVALALGHRAHDDAHAIGDIELLHDLTQAEAFFGIFDLAGNAELVRIGHQDEVASCQGNIRGDSRSLGANGAFGDLNHDFRADRIDVRDVLGCDFFMLFLGAAFSFDFFESGIKCGGQGVPEVEECVFVLADIDEHGLQTGFDILDLSFEDAADDVVFSFAFQGVFFKDSVFEKGDAAFQFFRIDDNGNTFFGITGSKAEGAFNFFKHFEKHSCKDICWLYAGIPLCGPWALSP